LRRRLRIADRLTRAGPARADDRWVHRLVRRIDCPRGPAGRPPRDVSPCCQLLLMIAVYPDDVNRAVVDSLPKSVTIVVDQ
jgi:hypothetical protein